MQPGAFGIQVSDLSPCPGRDEVGCGPVQSSSLEITQMTSKPATILRIIVGPFLVRNICKMCLSYELNDAVDEVQRVLIYRVPSTLAETVHCAYVNALCGP